MWWSSRARIALCLNNNRAAASDTRNALLHTYVASRGPQTEAEDAKNVGPFVGLHA